MVNIGKSVQNLVMLVIGIVVVLSVYVALAPTLSASLSNLTGIGAPLASVFVAIVPLLLLAGILIWVIMHSIKPAK